MCLISQLAKPLIAKHNIFTYKALIIRNGEYYSPFMNMPVKLNSKIIAQKNLHGDTDIIKTDNNKNLTQVCSFYIHSMLYDTHQYHETIYGRIEYALCIIPKGTEYYIDINMADICSRTLYVTDNIMSIEEIKKPIFTYRDILHQLYKEMIDRNKVSSGWLLKNDNTFIHPSDYIKYMRDSIIGVVGYVNNDFAYIVSLDEFSGFKRNNKCINKSDIYICLLDLIHFSEDDNDGIRNCQHVLSSNDVYPWYTFANEYCTNGTNKGDWYIPAGKEIIELYTRERLFINVGLKMLNADIIGDKDAYFVSTYYNTDFTLCYLTNINTLQGWFDKDEKVKLRLITRKKIE